MLVLRRHRRFEEYILQKGDRPKKIIKQWVEAGWKPHPRHKEFKFRNVVIREGKCVIVPGNIFKGILCRTK